MKVAIITDQHFGARKNSKLFHDYFLKFYEEVFFPSLEAEGITTVIDMGDTFDSRKGIDFSALAWAKDHYYDRLKEMGVQVHTIIGNHTAYYKNTNDLTGVGLFLREYDNVKIYPEAEEVRLDKTKFLRRLALTRCLTTTIPLTETTIRTIIASKMLSIVNCGTDESCYYYGSTLRCP